MKIVKASYFIEKPNVATSKGKESILNAIESAARTCYKSEDRIQPGSAEALIKRLIASGHEAMLEHGDYIFLLDNYRIYEDVVNALQSIKDMGFPTPMLEMSYVNDRPIVSGNIRVWREMLKYETPINTYFIGHIDPVFTNDFAYEITRVDPHIKQIQYKDLIGREEHLTHQRQTVRFIVDRGVSHELVRHRVASFAQESTRYCNYGKEKFGKEITFIKPAFWEKGSEQYKHWSKACSFTENAYFKLLEDGATPQEARAVLPNSLKTEIVVTANVREWRHIFKLRTAKDAHPQMREVMTPLLAEMTMYLPELFGDIQP